MSFGHFWNICAIRDSGDLTFPYFYLLLLFLFILFFYILTFPLRILIPSKLKCQTIIMFSLYLFKTLFFYAPYLSHLVFFLCSISISISSPLSMFLICCAFYLIETCISFLLFFFSPNFNLFCSSSHPSC